MVNVFHYLESCQNIGRRSYQEDRWLSISADINEAKVSLVAVSDGMGGAGNGDIAAEIVIKNLNNFWIELLRNENLDVNLLSDALRTHIINSNNQIREYGIQNNSEGMGATLSGALIINDKLLAFNAGDSRVYIADDSELLQITKDHSAFQDALDRGLDVSNIHIGKNALYNCLDGSEDIKIDFYDNAGLLYDVLNKCILVCTDGLHGVVPDDVIFEIISRLGYLNGECYQIVSEFVDTALLNGGSDNTTCVLTVCTNQIVRGKKIAPIKSSSTSWSNFGSKLALIVPIILISVALVFVLLTEFDVINLSNDNFNTQNIASSSETNESTTQINGIDSTDKEVFNEVNTNNAYNYDTRDNRPIDGLMTNSIDDELDSKSTTESTDTENLERIIFHDVKPGETLYSILNVYRTTYGKNYEIDHILRINDINDPTKIRVGQSLRIQDSGTLDINESDRVSQSIIDSTSVIETLDTQTSEVNDSLMNTNHQLETQINTKLLTDSLRLNLLDSIQVDLRKDTLDTVNESEKDSIKIDFH